MKTEITMSVSLLRTARALKYASVLVATALLAACSGGGPGTVQNPVTSAPPVQDYTGNPAQNADVQAFALNLWTNIKGNDRCGGCHNATGQTPRFARNDDVNLAYEAANTVVNLAQPDQSRMVQKVGGGHNCWLASPKACADTLTVWIRNWAGSAATGGRTIELQAPTIKEVGASKAFPNSSQDFFDTVYPVLTQANRGNCGRCHSAGAAVPQQPFFASTDVSEAYAAAKVKMNLDNPDLSRFVVRLRTEFHNCWTIGGAVDCAKSADAMQAAIEAFAARVTADPVDPSLVTSKALGLYDGTIAAGGNRYDNNVIALYEFKEGANPPGDGQANNIAYDTSGVEPAANLQLTTSDMWVGGWGVAIKPGQKGQASSSSSKKLSDKIKSTGEFTVEAWIAPANVVQEDAYAVSYSGGTMARNFTLAQRAYQYEALTRTSETDANGNPSLLTRDTDRDAQASLQHVVLTFDPINGRRIYVNGVYTGDADPRGGGGSLSDWDDSFVLVVGNETSLNRQWQGTIKLLAIHNRALTQTQIQQNFAAGVGERYFLLFSVSHLVNVPQAYVLFEASEYDSYAYLFKNPTFLSLDPTVSVDTTFTLKGMRIGVDGAEAKTGQTYIPLNVTVGGANYVKGTGQLLANVGAVIAGQKGAKNDQFFLTFEQLDTHSHPVTEAPLPANLDDPGESLAPDDPAMPKYGLRTFEELSATFSRITGVAPTSPKVATTYATVKQQMPTVEDVNTFLPAHQTGIAQLAIAYCSAMVDDNAKRAAFLNPAADINPHQNMSVLGSAGSVNRTAIITALQNKAIGNLLTQPDLPKTKTAIEELFDRLQDTSPGGGANVNSPDGAGIAMKGACSAVLGSATSLIQ